MKLKKRKTELIIKVAADTKKRSGLSLDASGLFYTGLEKVVFFKYIFWGKVLFIRI
jgi:hypothetical protein